MFRQKKENNHFRSSSYEAPRWNSVIMDIKINHLAAEKNLSFFASYNYSI